MYDVFISFRNVEPDRTIAKELYDALRKVGVEAFFSESILKTNEQEKFDRAIEQALIESKVLIVVATKLEHVNARWVRHEWEYFTNQINGGNPNKHILTVMDGFPIISLPPAFAGIQNSKINEIPNAVSKTLRILRRKPGSDPTPYGGGNGSGKGQSLGLGISNKWLAAAFAAIALFIILTAVITGAVMRGGSGSDDGFTTQITDQANSSESTSKSTTTEAPVPTTTSGKKSIHYVGETVTFGSYIQSGSNAEPLKWEVIEVDGNRALMVTCDVVDCVKYNESESSVTWSTCSLRSWLNNDFMDSAFSTEDRSKIVLVANNNPKNPDYPEISAGSDTQDYVFLLSVDEVKEYLHGSSSRKMKPTNYAKNRGVLVRDGICFWWLRTPGFEESNAVVITETGAINTRGGDVNGHNIGVRPAIWINE